IRCEIQQRTSVCVTGRRIPAQRRGARAPAIRRRCAVSVPALVTTRDEQACREWHEQEKNAPAECRVHRPPNFFLARTPTLVVRRGAAQSDGRPLAGDLAAFYSDYVGSQEHRTHHRRFSVARFVRSEEGRVREGW